MDTAVIVKNPRHKLCFGGLAATEGIGQVGAECQKQPLHKELEFFAKAPVYPEVEDAVEETIGGGQPHHHELDPLWYAITRDRWHEGKRLKVGQCQKSITDKNSQHGIRKI